MKLNLKDNHTGGTIKNAIFVAIIVLCNTVGNLFLAIRMNAMPDFGKTPWLSYAGIILTSTTFWLGVVLLAISMLAQLAMYTWADLSYILPVTASGYVITAILGKFFLAENPSILRWIGVLIISFGVVLVAETRPDTKHLEGSGQ